MSNNNIQKQENFQKVVTNFQGVLRKMVDQFLTEYGHIRKVINLNEFCYYLEKEGYKFECPYKQGSAYSVEIAAAYENQLIGKQQLTYSFSFKLENAIYVNFEFKPYMASNYSVTLGITTDEILEIANTTYALDLAII